MRKITSLTALVSFLLLLLNSVVLYIAPHGRIAYWADWRFWGLTKTEWANQHIIIGILFLVAIFVHTYYNWKPVVAYLKNQARQVRVFTREFNIALLLVVACTIGAYAEISPFRWVHEFSESIKSEAGQTYGEPPYGRAELSSLKIFAEKTGIDITEGLNRLHKSGIQIESEQQTLLDIAKQNDTSPQQLYLWMKPAKLPDADNGFPDTPPAGFGKRSLTDICKEYGLSLSDTLETLKKDGVTATPETTVKQIAEQNNITTQEVFTAISNAAAPGA
jgi:hypothetical protein